MLFRFDNFIENRFFLRLVGILLLCLFWIWLVTPSRFTPYPLEGYLSEPIQSPSVNASSWQDEDATYMPLADYDITARVLSVERYYVDSGARFAPYDFALGWGEMSDFSLAEKLHINQALRYYSYRWGKEGPPLAQAVITKSSSNHHLVPKNSHIKRELSRVKPGDVVRLTGKLVQISLPNGWRWKSSLTRHDTGAGSCELLWVESITRRTVQ